MTTWRTTRIDSRLNQAAVGSPSTGSSRKVVGASFHDLNSTLRVMRREVLDQMTIYGNMYRYLPAVAYRQGFRVDEVQVRHLSEWGSSSVFGPGIYLRRALDVLGLMFLARFTHKPLRFFGTLGGFLMFIGGLLAGVALMEWVLRSGDFSLYKTPFFLVGVLMGVPRRSDRRLRTRGGDHRVHPGAERPGVPDRADLRVMGTTTETTGESGGYGPGRQRPSWSARRYRTDTAAMGPVRFSLRRTGRSSTCRAGRARVVGRNSSTGGPIPGRSSAATRSSGVLPLTEWRGGGLGAGR